MALTSRALLRARNVPNAETLLRLLLLHISAGLSLKQASVRAREQGLAKISDVALLNRLRAAGPWLERLCNALATKTWAQRPWPLLEQGYRLRAVDTSTIQQPGAHTTNWRLHYSLALPALSCDELVLTDAQGGESLRRFHFAAKDLLLADRGYCRAEGLAYVQAAQAHYVVRLHSTSLALRVSGQAKFDPRALVRTVHRFRPKEWDVEFRQAGRSYPARLCALRRNATAFAREKALAKESARKNGRPLSERSLELAEYILVLTSLPSQEATCAQVLELYRLRWQIELAFKRLKSLLQIGHLHTYDEASSRAWLQGKLLTALLIERLLLEAEIFSPWGYPLAGFESLEPVH